MCEILIKTSKFKMVWAVHAEARLEKFGNGPEIANLGPILE